jgi:hypothetical protein
MFDRFKGAGKRLDDIDLPRIGSQIGVGEDVLHAFLDVESSGSGFDADGRVKMLFEPHVFYKELGISKKRDAAVARGLAYQKWRAKPYPADSYPRLIDAMEINETAALRSASWGLGQIMGFNHLACGYSTVQKMVAAFAEDEESQLAAMVEFIKSKRLDQALRDRNWKKIELVYNGGGFHGSYAVKMQNAYNRWQKIKDTPFDPKTLPPFTPRVPPFTPPPPKGAPAGPIAALIAALVAGLVALFSQIGIDIKEWLPW